MGVWHAARDESGLELMSSRPEAMSDDLAACCSCRRRTTGRHRDTVDGRMRALAWLSDTDGCESTSFSTLFISLMGPGISRLISTAVMVVGEHQQRSSSTAPWTVALSHNSCQSAKLGAGRPCCDGWLWVHALLTQQSGWRCTCLHALHPLSGTRHSMATARGR